MTALFGRRDHALNACGDTDPGLPEPSGKHATCAWCRKDWRSIVELIEHVEAAHLDHIDSTPERCATPLTTEA